MRIVPTATTLLLTLPALVLAQGVPEGYRPVDGTVEDYTDNGVSFRQMQHGNANMAVQTGLYRPVLPTLWSKAGLPSRDETTGLHMPGEFIYRAPGVTAMIANPEYLVLRTNDPTAERFWVELNARPIVDGAFTEVVPAGTVFDLIPDRGGSITPDLPADGWIDTRIDGRFHGRVDGRLHTQVNTQAPTGQMDGRVTSQPQP